MTATTGVFLADEREPQITKKSPPSVRANGEAVKRVEPAKADHADPAKLNEQELKSAIIAVWKKHEELAKQDLAPMLYWLREKLRAQGARNDIDDRDRGFAAWVEEHLDFSRRTADRWCNWYAIQAGLKEPTSGQVSKSDVELWEEVLDQHKGKHQIAFNYWVPKELHVQFDKALTKIQKQFSLENKKEALVRGVIYAAKVMDKGTAGRGLSKVVGRVSLRRQKSKAGSRSEVRAGVRPAHGVGRVNGKVLVAARVDGTVRHKQGLHDTSRRRGEGGSKTMRAAAGR
jgi:hypothetical protein